MPDEPVWIRHDTVRAIHLRQLAEHGGSEGVRDEGLLDSALARPKNLLAYSDEPPALAALAAAYAMGLVKNHPFVDGNKRTAYVGLPRLLDTKRKRYPSAEGNKVSHFPRSGRREPVGERARGLDSRPLTRSHGMRGSDSRRDEWSE